MQTICRWDKIIFFLNHTFFENQSDESREELGAAAPSYQGIEFSSVVT